MDLPVTILHIDREYQISYWIIRDKVKITSTVTLPQAIELLKSIEFNLILSEPHNMAILHEPPKADGLEE